MNGKEAICGYVHIGDFAHENGVSIRTIRYYEELGLIQPACRSKGGFRLYGGESRKRLQMIRLLRAVGIPLAEIRGIFNAKQACTEGGRSVRRLREILTQKAGVIGDRLADLGRMKSDLEATIRLLRICEDCRHEVLVDRERCASCSRISAKAELPDAFRALLQ